MDIWGGSFFHVFYLDSGNAINTAITISQGVTEPFLHYVHGTFVYVAFNVTFHTIEVILRQEDLRTNENIT